MTSSRVREEVWSLGTLTDDQRFIGIQQAPGAEEATVEELVPGSERVAEVEIGDQTWTRWSSPDDETTYSRVVPGPREDTTAVVTSDVDRTTLERYVASLS